MYRRKFNSELWKKIFENHVATFTDYGNIKVLDFKAPDTNIYRIRFLFEEDYCRLHISGDLGELIAANFDNMTFDKFSDYVNNINYFTEKILCHSRPIFKYDIEKAKEQLKELAEKNDWSGYLCVGSDELDTVMDDILMGFNDEKGIGDKGYDSLVELEEDAYEIVKNIGREETDILDIYMLAFKLAKKQLNGKGGNEV